MTQPRAYVIAHPGSCAVDDCVSSLKQYQWSYEVVPATLGTTITADTWASIGVELRPTGKMSRRLGAQGCWISHYLLWRKCVESNSPLIVLEHDAVVTAQWPLDFVVDPHLVKLYTTAECKINPTYGLWSKGAHAYTITPVQAQQLICYSQQHGAEAVDKHLGSSVLDWTFYTKDLVQLNPNRGPGSTSRTLR